MNDFGSTLPGEKVIVYTHRHWYWLAARYGWLFLLALIPLAVLFVSFVFLDGLAFLLPPTTADGGLARAFLGSVFVLTGLASPLWYLWLGVRAVLNLYRYLHDVWIVTNIRLIDLDKNTIFNQNRSEALLVNIQDIDVRVEGILPKFLGFGDIQVQTAGTREHFRFITIPRPHQVADVIQQELLRSRGLKRQAKALSRGI
ncbi:MAG: PH domain-containing protein [Dehalococcoidia bacterium]|nr:PH domain-containing protein [Dehalococcoidia bacterium]